MGSTSSSLFTEHGSGWRWEVHLLVYSQNMGQDGDGQFIFSLFTEHGSGWRWAVHLLVYSQNMGQDGDGKFIF